MFLLLKIFSIRKSFIVWKFATKPLEYFNELTKHWQIYVFADRKNKVNN